MSDEQRHHLDALVEVKNWLQATLTALDVGDVKSGSMLHLKLREVMKDYRAKTESEDDETADRPSVSPVTVNPTEDAFYEKAEKMVYSQHRVPEGSNPF